MPRNTSDVYEIGWRRKKPKLADQKRARGGSLRSHLECHEVPVSPETPHFPVRTRRYPEKREKLNMKDQEATVSNCHTWLCTKSVQIRINVSFHFGCDCEGLWDRHDLQLGGVEVETIRWGPNKAEVSATAPASKSIHPRVPPTKETSFFTASGTCQDTPLSGEGFSLSSLSREWGQDLGTIPGTTVTWITGHFTVPGRLREGWTYMVPWRQSSQKNTFHLWHSGQFSYLLCHGKVGQNQDPHFADGEREAESERKKQKCLPIPGGCLHY